MIFISRLPAVAFFFGSATKEKKVKWSKKQLGCSRQGSYLHVWLRAPGHEAWATNFQGAKLGALRLPFPLPLSSKIGEDWKEDPGSLASHCLLQVPAHLSWCSQRPSFG